jgi:hypothetical protein
MYLLCLYGLWNSLGVYIGDCLQSWVEQYVPAALKISNTEFSICGFLLVSV